MNLLSSGVHAPLFAFEPTLEEALADPIVAHLLKSDGLEFKDVKSSLETYRVRLLARGRAAR